MNAAMSLSSVGGWGNAKGVSTVLKLMLLVSFSVLITSADAAFH